MASNAYIPLPPNTSKTVTASTTSSQFYLDLSATGNSVNNVLVTNLDATNPVYVNWAASGSVTASNVGFPVIPFYPTVITMNPVNGFDSNITVAVISTAGTPTVVFTPVA
jgi:hypothetical protein